VAALEVVEEYRQRRARAGASVRRSQPSCRLAA